LITLLISGKRTIATLFSVLNISDEHLMYFEAELILTVQCDILGH